MDSWSLIMDSRSQFMDSRSQFMDSWSQFHGLAESIHGLVEPIHGLVESIHGLAESRLTSFGRSRSFHGRRWNWNESLAPAIVSDSACTPDGSPRDPGDSPRDPLPCSRVSRTRQQPVDPSNFDRRHRLSAVLALARSSGHLHDLSRPTASAPPVPYSREAHDALLPHHTLPPLWSRRFHPAAQAVSTFVKPVGRDRLLDRVRQLTTADQSRIHLLLIDDDTSLHELLDEELTHLGYTIESAFNGETGLAAAKANAPDVIILDLMMPGMTGFEVAGLLKDHPSTARIPILVLTSKEISADDRRGLQSNVAACIQEGKSARDQLVAEIRRLRRASVRTKRRQYDDQTVSELFAVGASTRRLLLRSTSRATSFDRIRIRILERSPNEHERLALPHPASEQSASQGAMGGRKRRTQRLHAGKEESLTHLGSGQ